MIMRCLSILLLSFFSVQVVISQNIDVEKLNRYFDALAGNDKFMGTVCVTSNGKTLYAKSVGFADVEAKIRATPRTRYKIGSISKTFTAVMIFQAIEQGKLTLLTKLDTYFPSVGNAGKITIGQMLSHRSGIHNFTADNDMSWADKPKTREEMIRIIENGGSDFEPDSRQQYSNSNYLLLSYILEDIYRMPYAKILETNIVKPLKLVHTDYGQKITPQKNDSYSYKFFDKWRIESEWHPTITVGAGGIVSTPCDLNLFFEALFGGKLISANGLQQMKAVSEKYGKGLMQMPFNNKTGYGHTGGIDGFQSVSVCFPDDGIAYSLTSNGSDYVINNISIAVLSAVYGLPFEIPDFATVNLTSDDLDKYLGVYTSGQLPIEITVTKKERTLVAQGSGQPAFDLTASKDNTFRFDQAGIVMLFDPVKGTMVLKQGGASFLMKKK